MDRRRFLKILAGAAAAPAVTYFLPPIGGWNSDVIVNPWPHMPYSLSIAVGVDDPIGRMIVDARKKWAHERLLRIAAHQRHLLWMYGNCVTYTRTA